MQPPELPPLLLPPELEPLLLPPQAQWHCHSPPTQLSAGTQLSGQKSSQVSGPHEPLLPLEVPLVPPLEVRRVEPLELPDEVPVPEVPREVRPEVPELTAVPLEVPALPPPVELSETASKS
jgi:hypothetical protein